MRQSTRLFVNTAVTYARMLLTVGIGLLITRLVLKALGVEDYGIYTAVGAAAALFASLSNALTSSNNRHLAVEIGRGDAAALRRVFATIFAIHLAAAAGVVALGLAVSPLVLGWATIPPDRLGEAQWVFYLSLGTLATGLLVTPFGSLIRAHQEIPIATAFELLSRLLMLAAVAALFLVDHNRLALYAAGVLAGTLIAGLGLIAACLVRYPEARANPLRPHRPLIRELLGFTGWSFVGASIFTLRMQGTVYMLNVLFDPTVNAGYAVALQVVGYQNQLVFAILSAVQPAMATLQGKGAQRAVGQLVHVSSKYPLYMALLVLVPLMLEGPMLLDLWLDRVPPYAVVFSQLSAAAMCLMFVSNGMGMLMNARGYLRGVTLIAVAGHLGGIAAAWIAVTLLDYGPLAFPIMALAGSAAVSLIMRPLFVTRVTEHTLTGWLRDAVLPMALVAGTAFATAALPRLLLPPGWTRLAGVILLPPLAMMPIIWRIGLSELERSHLKRLATRITRQGGRGGGLL